MFSSWIQQFMDFPHAESILFYDEVGSDLVFQISQKQSEYTIINVWGDEGMWTLEREFLVLVPISEYIFRI